MTFSNFDKDPKSQKKCYFRYLYTLLYVSIALIDFIEKKTLYKNGWSLSSHYKNRCFVKEILPNKQSLLEENIVLQFWKGDFDRIMQTTKNGGYFF